MTASRRQPTRTRAVGALFFLLAVAGALIAASRADAYIYWLEIDRGTVARADLDGSGVDKDFLDAPAAGTIAITDRHIYWATEEHGVYSIGRANLDGTDADPHFITQVGYPYGLAVDSRHIYWVNQQFIGRANLDGTGVDASFITGVRTSFGIAANDQYVYWAQSGAGAPGTIGRANIDGTGVDRTFIDRPARAVAATADHLYWTEPGSIGRVDVDGTNMNPDFIQGVAPAWEGLTTAAGHIYWLEGQYPASTWIGRARLDGSDVDLQLVTGLEEPYGTIGVDGLRRPATARSQNTQRQPGDAIHVTVEVHADQRVTAQASGTVRVESRFFPYKLASRSVDVNAGATEKLAVKPVGSDAEKIARALDHDQKVVARVEVRMEGRGLNVNTETERIRLRR